MGSSPSAKIFFGIKFSDEQETDRLEEIFAEKKGIENEYWTVQKALSEAGIDFILDGDSMNGNGSTYIAVEASMIGGNWDHPVEIDPTKLVIQAEWRTKLEEFLELMEIKVDDKPRLMLTCAYG